MLNILFCNLFEHNDHMNDVINLIHHQQVVWCLIMRGTELLFVALLLILWHIIVWQSNAQLTLHLLPQLLASLLQPLKIWLIWRLKQLRWFIKIPFFRASVSSSRASFSSIIFSVILFLFSSTASLSVVTFALSWSTSVWSLI